MSLSLNNQTYEWYTHCEHCDAEVERVAEGDNLEDDGDSVMAYFPEMPCPTCGGTLDADSAEVTDWWEDIIKGYYDPRS